MAKNKTAETSASVNDFLQTVEDESYRNDCFRLIAWMTEVSGCEPKMWGTSIVGFGTYHYVYASGHEGDAPLIAFSPRKSSFSLYVFTGLEQHRHLLENLGKFKTGKACIYVKKLDDLQEEVLKSLMKETINYLKLLYPTAH